jgi:hypothetical protein
MNESKQKFLRSFLDEKLDSGNTLSKNQIDKEEDEFPDKGQDRKEAYKGRGVSLKNLKGVGNTDTEDVVTPRTKFGKLRKWARTMKNLNNRNKERRRRVYDQVKANKDEPAIITSHGKGKDKKRNVVAGNTRLSLRRALGKPLKAHVYRSSKPFTEGVSKPMNNKNRIRSRNVRRKLGNISSMFSRTDRRGRAAAHQAMYAKTSEERDSGAAKEKRLASYRHPENANLGYAGTALVEAVKKKAKQKKKGRCWKGYKPTPGKEPYSKGSCMPEALKKFDEQLLDELRGKFASKRYYKAYHGPFSVDNMPKKGKGPRVDRRTYKLHQKFQNRRQDLIDKGKITPPSRRRYENEPETNPNR